MLEYTLRLLGHSVRALSAPRLSYLDESVLTMRVWPSDVDSFGHMNNGRYLTLMDLGRNDLIVRAGAMKLWLMRRWTPLLGGVTIRYKRPLRPFRRYELHTQILCWDDKWIYFRQRFERQGKVYAVALLKGLLRHMHGGEKVPPREIPMSLGLSPESPPMPEAVTRWIEAESKLT